MTIGTQPVIGIVPSFDEGDNIPASNDVKRIYIRHEYMRHLAEVGGVPIILRPDMSVANITELCDGIVISGGEDIEPHFYGATPLASMRFNEPKSRFVWEMDLIEACDKSNLPISGICYGLTIVARAPDGIIEAITGRGHFGMQWHPESDATGIHVYRAFVEHCVCTK